MRDGVITYLTDDVDMTRFDIPDNCTEASSKVMKASIAIKND